MGMMLAQPMRGAPWFMEWTTTDRPITEGQQEANRKHKHKQHLKLMPSTLTFQKFAEGSQGKAGEAHWLVFLEGAEDLIGGGLVRILSIGSMSTI